MFMLRFFMIKCDSRGGEKDIDRDCRERLCMCTWRICRERERDYRHAQRDYVQTMQKNKL